MNLTMLDFWELWLPIFNCRTLCLWITSHSSLWTFGIPLEQTFVTKLKKVNKTNKFINNKQVQEQLHKQGVQLS